MGTEAFVGLPALGKVAALAQDAGLEVRPSFYTSSRGQPVPHKRKVWIDGVWCSVFMHRAYRYAEPKNPNTRKLVQVESAPLREDKVKPGILIFYIKIDDAFAFEDVFCIPASYYYRRCPKGSTHIPIEPAKRPERGAAISWEKFRGARGLQLSLRWVKATP